MLTLSPVSNPVWRYHRRDGEAEIGGLQSWAQEALREKCGLEVKARATRYLPFSYSPSLVCICLRRSFCAALLTQHLGKAELEREQEGSVSACQNRRQNKGRQADWQEPTPLPPVAHSQPLFLGQKYLELPGEQMISQVGTTGSGWAAMQYKGLLTFGSSPNAQT